MMAALRHWPTAFLAMGSHDAMRSLTRDNCVCCALVLAIVNEAQTA